MTTLVRLIGLLLPACVSYALPLAAQPDEKFGKLTGEEINLVQCAFDPEAAAAVLIDEGNSSHDDQYRLITNIHERIKILKEPAIKEESEVTIYFRHEDDFEYISNIVAVTYNVDANGTITEYPVDRKSIYTKKINDRVSEMSFAFPQVRVGSILEYRYTSTKKHYGGLSDWTFQSHLPVYRSTYWLVPAPNLEFSYLVQKADNYPLTLKHDKSSAQIFFEMKNLPGLDDEPYMDAREDYLQKVRFQLTGYNGSVGKVKRMNNWKEAAKELNNDPDYGGHCKSGPREAENFVALAIAGKTDAEKLQIVVQYVRSTLSWDGRQGVYPEPATKTLWAKKSGNAAAINLALVHLLREAGLDASPVLISERGNGRINVSSPFLREFNTSYASATINGRTYFLNATDDTPPLLTPSSILNTTAVVIRPRSGDVVQIAEDSARYSTHINLMTKLDENGKLKGTMHISSRNYASLAVLGAYKSSPADYQEKYLKKNWTGIEVDSFKLSNQDDLLQPLMQDCKYQSQVQETGDYSFLPLNLFSDYQTNPFSSKKRFSNVNFGYKRSFTLNHYIILPANYTVDAVPKNIKLVSQDRSVTFVREVFYTAGSGQLIARMRVEIDKSLFEVSEYEALREFYSKMIDMMNEQAVLKKISK